MKMEQRCGHLRFSLKTMDEKHEYRWTGLEAMEVNTYRRRVVMSMSSICYLLLRVSSLIGTTSNHATPYQTLKAATQTTGYNMRFTSTYTNIYVIFNHFHN